jgi:3,4-dihydroxy 2-butanone 4-phosphate synthase/GTP cyclohydrolase II
MPVRPHAESMHYLRTKRDRLGHLIEGLDDLDDAAEPVAGGLSGGAANGGAGAQPAELAEDLS